MGGAIGDGTVFYSCLFPAKTKPETPPQAPPIKWAIWEILSAEKSPLKISLPKYNTKTNRNVRGISPSLKEVMDPKMINANTTPDAPNSP